MRGGFLVVAAVLVVVVAGRRPACAVDFVHEVVLAGGDSGTPGMVPGDAAASEPLDDRLAFAEHWMTFWNDPLRNDHSGTGFITEDGKGRPVEAVFA